MAETSDNSLSRAAFESLFALELREARRQLLEAFDRAYLSHMLERVHGNVAAAARAADVDRVTLFRMLRRLGLRVERSGGAILSSASIESSLGDPQHGDGPR